MKILRFLFCLIMSFATYVASDAQGYQDLESALGNVAFVVYPVGAKPNIVDFTTAYLTSMAPEDPNADAESEWFKYLKGQKIKSNSKIIVDKKNGYMRYEEKSIADNDMSYMEICYWNCADNAHKLLAINNGAIRNGEEVCEEFTGCWFFLYDNATKIATVIDSDYINALFDGDGCAIFKLPRKGKNLKVTYYSIDEVTEYDLLWNGYTF